MSTCTRRIGTAGIIVLASLTGACADANLTGLDVPGQPAHSVSIAATAWTASGPGSVAVVSDGTAGDAVMTYDYRPGDYNFYTWDFETTADQTATVTRPWSWSGDHESIEGTARVVLYAVVNDAVVATLLDVNTGFFFFTGTYTFNVSAGDTYGFRFGGTSTLDSGPHLAGAFRVDMPEAPVDPVTVEDCKDDGWMAYGFQNQGQCIAFVQTGHDSR
jgi:hypothetical protein